MRGRRIQAGRCDKNNICRLIVSDKGCGENAAAFGISVCLYVYLSQRIISVSLMPLQQARE